jgi:hypothetical protein
MGKPIEIDELSDVIDSFVDKYLENGYLTGPVGAEYASDFGLSMTVEVADDDADLIEIATNITSDEKEMKVSPERMEEIADMLCDKLAAIVKPILVKNGYKAEQLVFTGVGLVDGEKP